jgi:hypothetical protein
VAGIVSVEWARWLVLNTGSQQRWYTIFALPACKEIDGRRLWSLSQTETLPLHDYPYQHRQLYLERC